ncbi:carboxylesterase family protein [Embleya scabrispora]|uniref:carboxylesterase family protein n=1 Tax=Embleya scabrispora TaxID=159449 RepID=UPI001319B891|nr:carboxylesterase family protein [Embleya scabrispora]MYS78726.1 carboxylesterase family protein [Streptomyces sp. SID5474]
MVKPTAGTLRGRTENGLAVFRGIPYAAAPVGDLRRRPARPHPGRHGVRDAARYGPSAPQIGRADAVLGGHGAPPFDEDCLTLNVWTPGRTTPDARSWSGSTAAASSAAPARCRSTRETPSRATATWSW